MLTRQEAQAMFAFDTSSRLGGYFESIKVGNGSNSELVVGKKGKHELSSRRWVQFLDRAKEITPSFRRQEKNDNSLDVIGLINECGCTVKSFCNLSEIKEELNPGDPEYEEFSQKISQKNKKIDGVSFPGMNKIFYRRGISKEQMNFVLMHELAHYLLGHEGVVFYKGPNGKKPHDPEEYHEEGDRLAAILLIPHEYIKEHMNDNNKKLAQLFGVSVKAVKKRKKEVYKEDNELCYGWHR